MGIMVHSFLTMGKAGDVYHQPYEPSHLTRQLPSPSPSQVLNRQLNPSDSDTCRAGGLSE